MDPAPNQMTDGYEAADAMLEAEYEDRNGCAYTEVETENITFDVEQDVCPTCGAEDCDGKCEEPGVCSTCGLDTCDGHYDDNGME